MYMHRRNISNPSISLLQVNLCLQLPLCLLLRGCSQSNDLRNRCHSRKAGGADQHIGVANRMATRKHSSAHALHSNKETKFEQKMIPSDSKFRHGSEAFGLFSCKILQDSQKSSPFKSYIRAYYATLAALALNPLGSPGDRL